MNYWRECIAEAADECGLSMTEDQLSALAESVEGAFENYGMYHGHDVIGNTAETQAQQELKRLRQEIKDREEWKNSTVPCPSCRDGIVHDIYGRPQQCERCDGRERIPRGLI